ncbi:probable leucine-rich repeat receptor-like protein kinase At5g49770 [Selaginella moellendorffii]|uniref:probable leucine-rich repeat receptor-like protein kinase At5g49770 n=1 Tax=Selaginella moellendorffii TaxID=88036 RepID=UPI000D1D0F41|nr:probable leucine-rich repeat receptor-like protein kinase At5g49770 [Selaginella moellendorffii]|eukprot:XP_024523265.1 probable leucine-rich repeat receptor-like protein kinase At5g49770 [Selaginella moellendorffii]
MGLARWAIQIILLWMFLASVALAVTNPADTAALRAVRVGWTSSNLNWNGDDPCGGWQGIGCDGQNVTSLDLGDFRLGGRLLPAIGDLVNLRTLILAFNPLITGLIPSELGRLSNLEFLSLQSCSFSGRIPAELGRLRRLRFLGLNSNRLDGSIPPELGLLTNCTWFDLSENNLSGELPVSSGIAGVGLNNLTSAIHFHLNNNSFVGRVPEEISVLPNLIHFLVDSNSMSGEIPAALANLPSLEILRLDNNNFSGPFPNITRLSGTLHEIHIRNNSFTSFPDISSLSQLLFVSMGLNRFPPQALPSFSTLRNLQSLELDGSNLSGDPSALLLISTLETLSLASNNLNSTLDLGNTSPSLTSIDLANNRIPEVSRAPPSSSYSVTLGGNPACNTPNLPSYINCSSNALGNEAWRPRQNCSSTNRICPREEIFNEASCTCGIPYILRFQFNAPTFSAMTSDRNEALRSEIARGTGIFIDQVWVDNFVFTDNFRFNATVAFFPPVGVRELSDQVKTDILRRYVLHTIDLIGFDPYHVFPIDLGDVTIRNGNGGLSAGAIAGISIGAVLVVLLVAGYAIRQKFRADKAKQATNPFASWGGGGKDNGEAPVIKGVRSFSFADLKKATSNFSSSHEIGVGGYGKVYKGFLLTGEVVAIKRAQAGSMQGAHEFKTEIELLSRLHHKNLVELVGFCFEHGEQMLVYEYMAGGSIHDHLMDQSKVFSWNKRLEIAIGSARGLSYLHELANPPIIHRDIKSSNILLDEMFVAKVADLGLSKVSMADEGKTHVSTQVKGTLGYLDPEYYMTNQLTDKSDVYSFGVVLLELLTARPPIENGKYVVREVRTALARGGLEEVIPLLDSSLEGYSARDLKRYLSLAMACVEEAAAQRPSMNDIVKELESLLGSSGGFRGSSIGGGEFHAISLYDDDSVALSSAGAFEYSGGYHISSKVEPK